jgi:hypothetical protein
MHGIDRSRQREAPSEPGRRRLAEHIEALVHGIAAELVDMLGEHRSDKRRHTMPGFAHG